MVNVSHAVAKRETGLQVRSYMQYGAITIGAAAVSWGLYTLAGAFGQDVMASVGLEVARAHAVVSTAPDAGAAAQNFIQSMGAGLTQILLITAVLAGGAVVYRSTQE